MNQFAVIVGELGTIVIQTKIELSTKISCLHRDAGSIIYSVLKLFYVVLVIVTCNNKYATV